MAKQTNFGGKRHTLTVEDQRKGGKRSGEVRRDLRDTREIVRRAMSMYLKNSDPAEINYLSEITDGANISAKEAMIYAQLNRAMNGDTKRICRASSRRAGRDTARSVSAGTYLRRMPYKACTNCGRVLFCPD